MNCILCKSSKNDDLIFGEFFNSGDLAVHHYCLLFGPSLLQNGDDHVGIQGFLIEDIEAEAKRIKNFECDICDEKSANLECRHCLKPFHTECAFNSSVNFIFEGDFPTFCCSSHLQSQTEEKIKKSDKCGICLERIKSKDKFRSIFIPCCKNSWFHHGCLQKYALSSGMCFKCPLCNDTKICREKLPKLGIFLPIKDADWELDQNFDDLYESPTLFCENYNCPNPVKHSSSPWEWKSCQYCAGNGVHLKCTSADNYTCKSCTEILEKKTEKSPSPSPVKRKTFKKRIRDFISDDESEQEENNNCSPSCACMSEVSTPGVKKRLRFICD